MNIPVWSEDPQSKHHSNSLNDEFNKIVDFITPG